MSLRTLLRTWFRLRLGTTETAVSLADTDEERTISDAIDTSRLQRRLPMGWRVKQDMVQFSGETVAEVVRLTSRHDGYQITCKPIDMLAPTERIEIYTRRSPTTSRTKHTTVDSLATALDTAVEIADTRCATVRRSGTRSPRGSPGWSASEPPADSR